MPCVYTAFKFLYWTAPNLETNGDVFSKLILAIEINSSAEKIDAQSVRKRLPAFANNNILLKSSSTKTNNCQYQTECLDDSSCSKDYLQCPASIQN